MAENEELLTVLIGLVRSNTEAIANVAVAVEKSVETNHRLGTEMVALRSIIAGAQKKIGGEIGPMVDKMKQTHAAMEAERGELRNAKAAGKAEERGGVDARISS